MSTTFQILVVGIGNDCRSAMAERHLRHRLNLLRLGPDVVGVASAGARAVEGAAMDPHAAHELARLGGRPHGFVARQLTRRMMQEADLVLSVTRAVRSRALEDEPSALHRTFTLREFATLAQLLQSPGSPEMFVAKAASHRWAVGLDHFDLADVVGGSQRKYRHVADQIADAASAISGLWNQMLAPAGPAA